MRRIVAILSAAVMIMAGLLTIGSPAQAATGYSCSNKHDRGDLTFPDGEYAQFTVYYRYCIPYDTDRYAYVKPYMTINSYNMPGYKMGCGAFARKYDGMRFNWYFWRPYNGFNYNPGPIEVGCDTSTMNTEAQEFPTNDVPRLYFGPGYGSDRQPRWKVNVTLMLNGYGDEHKAHQQDFKPS